MKKQLLTVAASLLMSGAAFAQFTAAQIWDLNQRVDPMPHNTINMSYFDIALSYNTRGVPLTGLSSAQPGLPLPTFKISSTVDGNKVICISQEKDGNDPWEDKERATFESDGTLDTSITIERSSNGAAFEKDAKVLITPAGTSNVSIRHAYRWNMNAWELSNKSFYYFNANRLDSMVTYRFTNSSDSSRNSFITYYYSTGLDSSLHSILQTSTNQFEVQNKVLVLQKEAGKTKQFAVESRNTTGGPFQRTATFTYKNGPTSKINKSLTINNLSIYPNPANETLQISLPNNTIVQNAYILNTNGQIVKEINNLDKVDVSNLTPGLYLIQVNTNSGTVTQKFIKN